MPLNDYTQDFYTYAQRPEFDFFGANRGAALSPISSPSNPSAPSQPAGSEFLSSTPAPVAPNSTYDFGGGGDAGDGGGAPGPGGAAPGTGSGTGGFSTNAANVGNALGSLAGLGLGVPGLGALGATAGAAVDANNSAYGNISVPTAALNAITFGLLGESVEGQEDEAEEAEAEVDDAVSFGTTPSNLSDVTVPTMTEPAINVAIDVAEAQAEAEAEAEAQADQDAMNEPAEADTGPGAAGATAAEADANAMSDPAEADTAGFGTGDGGDGGDSVVCTALYDTRLIDRSMWLPAEDFGARLRRERPAFMAGYWTLCRPLARLVRRSRSAGIIARAVFKPAIREMSRRMGYARRGNRRGAVLILLGSILFVPAGLVSDLLKRGKRGA